MRAIQPQIALKMTTNDADTIWATMRNEATREAQNEPMLASFLHETILNHICFEDALSYQLAGKLGNPTIRAMSIREVIDESLASDPGVSQAARADVQAIRDRDPACQGLSVPFLYFKGFQALQSYRIAHSLWRQGREALALYLQNRISEIFSVDIHPAASIGQGILIDHATSLVIGETAVVGDNVSMLHEVTLGGTGKQTGDRHPKVSHCVLIGAGAKILGNVDIGEGAMIGAGSVVLESVPAHCTAAGVPAKIIGRAKVAQPALEMDQCLSSE